MVQTVIENWLQTAWPFRLQTSRCRSGCLLGLGFDESSDSALLSSFTTSEYFSSALLISLSFSGGKLCNQAHYSPSERLGTRHERTGFGTPNLKITIWWPKFVCHNLVHKTKFVDSNLKFAANDKKKQRSEFDDRIGIVHQICKSQFGAQSRICESQFSAQNRICKSPLSAQNRICKSQFSAQKRICGQHWNLMINFEGNYTPFPTLEVGGAVASWLVHLTPEQAELCYVLGQDTLLSQCLSPPRYLSGYRGIVADT